MFTLFALRWLSNHFNGIVGSQLIDIVDKKNEKRYKRDERRGQTQDDSYSTSQTFFRHNSIFLNNSKRDSDDENSWRRKFFGRNRSRESPAPFPYETDADYVEYDHDIPIDGANTDVDPVGSPILQERGDGSEEILVDAFEDGSSVICKLCKSLVKKNRWDAHRDIWCPSIDGGENSSILEGDDE